jgi:hypothetical protein
MRAECCLRIYVIYPCVCSIGIKQRASDSQFGLMAEGASLKARVRLVRMVPYKRPRAVNSVWRH